MKIIVPMAGMGKRMRPHTLTVPKPLIPVGGKPIVQKIIEDLEEVCGEGIEEVAYIIHPSFGKAVEQTLVEVAQKLGAKGTICYQEEALGTAHAIMCAKESLSGNVLVVFADTLFKAGFKLDRSKDGIIWVQQIEDPSQFGVVKLNANGVITDFIEKPQTFVSDLAIIGIYYFKDGENLRNELQYLLDNDIREKGEFQLTNALENMKAKGMQFETGKVAEWLDCGNKNATVYTNSRILFHMHAAGEPMVHESAKLKDSLVIQPSYIGPNVVIEHAVVGPYASIGEGTIIKDSVISNAIIQTNSSILNAVIHNAMIGNHATYAGERKDLSIGDYSTTI
ncbi:MAG: sugar phosphate nucleotidyltransferase [Bacteroidia bacterium]|jgi:glucose-1-phosphate thymidylyltransferase|nr:sugar phosphate nucleotidyltransferase [Bacteroidia bacterium]